MQPIAPNVSAAGPINHEKSVRTPGIRSKMNTAVENPSVAKTNQTSPITKPFGANDRVGTSIDLLMCLIRRQSFPLIVTLEMKNHINAPPDAQKSRIESQVSSKGCLALRGMAITANIIGRTPRRRRDHVKQHGWVGTEPGSDL